MKNYNFDCLELEKHPSAFKLQQNSEKSIMSQNKQDELEMVQKSDEYFELNSNNS